MANDYQMNRDLSAINSTLLGSNRKTVPNVQVIFVGSVYSTTKNTAPIINHPTNLDQTHDQFCALLDSIYDRLATNRHIYICKWINFDACVCDPNHM